MVATVGSEGVLDTGASKTVVGSDRIRSVLQGLSKERRARVKKVSSDVTFRFGNSGTLTSKQALLIPTSGQFWIRIEVIPGNTPLMISNRLLKDLNAVIYVRDGYLLLNGRKVETRSDDRGLTIVDLAELLDTCSDEIFLSYGNQKHTAESSSSRTSETSTEQSPTTNHTAGRPFPEAAVHDVQQSVETSTRISPQRRSSCDDRQPRSAQSQTSTAPPYLATQHRVSRDAQHELCKAGREDRGPATRGCPRRADSGHHRPKLGGRTAGVGTVPQHRCDEATRSEQPARVGESLIAGRQVQGTHSQRDLREGSGIRHLDGQERVPLLTLGTQLPELCPSKTPSHGSRAAKAGEEQTVGDNVNGDKNDARAHIHDRTGIRGVENEERCPKQLSERIILPDDGGDERPRTEGGDATSSSTSGVGEAGRNDRRTREGVISAETDDATLHEDDVRTEPGSLDAIKGLCQQIEEQILKIESQIGHVHASQKYLTQNFYRLPQLDVLEISPTSGDMIAADVKKRQGRAHKIMVSEINSQNDDYKPLWKWIWTYQPRHIWIDFRQPCTKQGDRDSKECWFGKLFLDLYEHQVENGRHLHISSNQHFFESTSPSLREMQYGLLSARHCMAELGVAPIGNNYLHKQT